MHKIVLILSVSLLLHFTVLQGYGQQAQAPTPADTVQTLMAKSDSLINALEKPNVSSLKDSIATVTGKFSQLKDSVHALAKPEIGGKLKAKLDSLKALELPPEKYQRKADSLMAAYKAQLEQKVANLKNKGKEKLASGKRKLDTLNNLNIDEAGAKEKLEAIKGELPSDELPDIDNLKVGDDLKEATDQIKEELPAIDNPLQGQTEEIKGEVLDIKSKANSEIDPLTAPAKEIGDDAKQISTEITEVTSEVSAVSEEVTAAKEGDFTKLEERAGEEIKKEANLSEELDQSSFEEFQGSIDENVKLGEQYQDPDFVKQRIMEKSKSVANDALARYKEKVAQAQVKAALDNIPKLNNLDSLVDFKKQRRQQKHWRDRSFTGVGWEVTHKDYTRLDVSPLIGYKLQRGLQVSCAYMYRVRFNAKEIDLSQTNTTYGPRASVLLDVWKSFYAKASMDYLRIYETSEEGLKGSWVPGVYVGIGKQYNITKYFRGDIFAMINLAYDDNKTPYQQPLNLRMHFYLDLNKRPPKPSWKQKLKRMKQKNFGQNN